MKKFKARFGYKKISQALNIPRSTVQAIILKWKEYQTTANLPRPGTRRRLIRDAAKRPMITLDELQRSTAEDNNQSYIAQIWPLWKSGKKKAIS